MEILDSKQRLYSNFTGWLWNMHTIMSVNVVKGEKTLSIQQTPKLIYFFLCNHYTVYFTVIPFLPFIDC